MGAGNRLFATDKGQSISYFCDTPMTIRKLSDDLIQIKEQKLPTCFSELFSGDGILPGPNLRGRPCWRPFLLPQSARL
jgi:hypothetical protein